MSDQALAAIYIMGFLVIGYFVGIFVEWCEDVHTKWKIFRSSRV